MTAPSPDLFTRLAPVLNVSDLAAERAFYESLGFPVIYEGISIRTSSPSALTPCTSAFSPPPRRTRRAS